MHHDPLPWDAEEVVVPIDLGVQWDVEATEPLLVQRHDAILIAHPTFDDPDRRWVVFDIQECKGALLCPPNDEAVDRHRLWTKGLRDCLWAGEVRGSHWRLALERQNAVHEQHDPAPWRDLRHWVLLFKESVFECIGKDLRTSRESTDQLREELATLLGDVP